MSDAIELHGQLANGQLHALLDRGWVHAVPSRWPEPFGLTATESMMRGTAVITSDIGGLAESVVQDVTGVRVVPGDEIALADALGRVLADRTLAERLGAAGRRRALDFFSIEQCVSQFETLYAALGAGEGRSVCAN
jgi:glycosyltransferase involved in cell wall biosynthesis